MNGLTNIITKINEQTEHSCNEIIEDAKAKADEIILSARNKADEITRELSEKTSAEADIIASKAKSSSLLEYKRVILAKKSEIIDSVVNDALETLCGAEESVYFGYIEKLVKNHAVEGDGLVIFNSKDLKRLPSGFAAKLSSLVSDKGGLKISEKAGDFNGGFVIEYPEIKVDCTFSSLVEDKLDEIRDEISKVLFA